MRKEVVYSDTPACIQRKAIMHCNNNLLEYIILWAAIFNYNVITLMKVAVIVFFI